MSPAPSSTGKKPISLELITEECIDQTLGFPSEPGDHTDPQAFGEGEKVAVEAAAQQHADSGCRKTFEARGPCLVGDGQSPDAAHLIPA
jgi:hypothetical protein